jgi:hypothetical protein
VDSALSPIEAMAGAVGGRSHGSLVREQLPQVSGMSILRARARMQVICITLR